MPTVHPCRTALDYTGVSGMVCLLCLCGEKNKLSEWWCRNLRLMSTVWNLEADDAELCAAIIPLTCSLHSAFTQHSLDRTARIACLNHANMMPKSQFWLPMRFSGLLLIKSLSTVCQMASTTLREQQLPCTPVGETSIMVNGWDQTLPLALRNTREDCSKKGGYTPPKPIAWKMWIPSFLDKVIILQINFEIRSRSPKWFTH